MKAYGTLTVNGDQRSASRRKASDIHWLGDWVIPKCQAQHFGGEKHFLPRQESNYNFLVTLSTEQFLVLSVRIAFLSVFKKCEEFELEQVILNKINLRNEDSDTFSCFHGCVSWYQIIHAHQQYLFLALWFFGLLPRHRDSYNFTLIHTDTSPFIAIKADIMRSVIIPMNKN